MVRLRFGWLLSNPYEVIGLLVQASTGRPSVVVSQPHSDDLIIKPKQPSGLTLQWQNMDPHCATFLQVHKYHHILMTALN
jgi:hypothetical protein